VDRALLLISINNRLLKPIALVLAGTLLGLVGPFKVVGDYLKSFAENREVGNQLRNVLQSLELFETSANASREIGEELYTTFDRLPLSMSVQEAEGLVSLMAQFSSNFSQLLSSVLQFGRECNFLISGQVEGFMEKVKKRKPEVHDFITAFGKNYRLETDSLDLSFLPMLLRIHGSKLGRRLAGRKGNQKLSREVAEGRQKLSRLIEKARVIRRRRLPRVKNRRLVFEYSASAEKMTKEGKRLIMDKKAVSELTRGMPQWMVELGELVDDLQKAMQGFGRPEYVHPKVPFRVGRTKTGRR